MTSNWNSTSKTRRAEKTLLQRNSTITHLTKLHISTRQQNDRFNDFQDILYSKVPNKRKYTIPNL